MKYCSECGSANLVLRSPGRDTHRRLVCNDCEKIFYHNPRVIAGCIVEDNGKYLMCKRAIKPRPGSWTLPAGFMECGETVEEAARREVWEETGAQVDIRAPYSIFSVPQIDEVYIMFRARLIEFSDDPGPETAEVAMLAPDEIPWENIFYPAIKDILQRYIEEKDRGVFGIYMGCSEDGTVHFMQ
ncbi:NUDIX hydrolase [Marinobacterium jannaschii]|uniref:NUDIX hydrolase n=1 Tax=Marinobacterium jannaschii TaxID=64970 RepID=UPI000ABC8E61|nr:NUDIX hydrolase [Marinobacterium jannaschii]